MKNLITEHIDIWTTAQMLKNNGGVGRGNGSTNQSIYGIKKLRELILELAVRGKLVQQQAGDEPASGLLEKIAKEKARLVKEEGLRTTAKTVIEMEEEFVGKPKGWEYCRLGNLAKFIDYRGRTPKKVGSGIPLITAKNVRFGYLSHEPKEYIYENEYQSWMTRGIPRLNDILFTTEAPLGNVAIVNIVEKFALAQRVICLQLHEPDTAFFLRILMMSKLFQDMLTNKATGMTATGIKAEKLKEILTVLPPLPEQHRIVTKVDELMDLCDRLEQQQIDSNIAHQSLVETLLATLTGAANQDEFVEIWQRIAKHFDILFTTEQSIDQLKQTILQLAVMGKLVPQDPNDEPASVLLEGIAKEKQRLIKEGRIKKQEPWLGIAEDGKQCDIPLGWEWSRLGNISYQITDGSHYTPVYVTEGIPFLSVKDMSSGYLDFSGTRFISHDQHEELIKACNPQRGDLLLTKVGTTGIPILIEIDKPFSIFVSVALIKFPQDLISGKFLVLLIRSPLVRCQSEEGTEGIGNKNLVLRKIAAFSIVIPPLAEQYRIVAKVDELMAICDALKARLNDAQATQAQLAGAIVEQTVS